MKAHLVWLTVIGVVNSAIGSYYYLRIIVMMYMREARKPAPVTPIPAALGLALALSILATLYLGILPNGVLRYAQESAQELLAPPSGTQIPADVQAQTALPQ